ncbi:MAG: sulfotransferase domain-containing protein [Erythrobacter sp.]|nr:MAG: sulfotransferase domain-containing protein [Erythrobacter sp.]
MESRKLDYVVIGAQKCATSWLYYCLKDHPGICVPDKKYEAGYIGGAVQRERGEAWFFDRFDPEPGQTTGDISVEYLWDEGAHLALRPYAEGAKLVVSLRHPVDRTVSGYFWLLRKGDLPNLPLEEGIADILNSRPGFPDPIAEPLGQAVGRSLYGPQIQRYIDTFGAENIKVVLYEDIAENGLAAVQEIYRYLGVDDSFEPPSLNAAPKKNSYNRILLAIENSTKSKVVAKLCNWAHQGLTLIAPRKDILPREHRRKLNQLFAPAVDETIRVLSQLPADQRPSEARLRSAWQLD